jgi:hypothetical protein
MQTPKWIRLAGQSVNSNSPVILSSIAVAGVITTAVLAAKAAIKTHKDTEHLEMSLKEKAQNNWQNFIPATISGAATIACVIGANQIGARRNAALLGAYTLADTAFREYKDEVVTQLGKVKERKITDEIQKRDITEHPVKDAQVIITGGGDQLCYDTLTGRYFKSDVESLRRAENEVNRRVLQDMYASHNEFYELIGLASTIVGDELGWNIDNVLELVFTSHLASDGTPCIAVGYSRLPRKDYGKF